MARSSRPRRCVLYVRLSQSDDASTSIVRQREALEQLAEREGWDVVALLEDDGLTGRKTRANADRALAMLRDGEADVLAVFKFDRWSRMGYRALADLISTVESRDGVLFVAMTEGLRSDQAAWRLIAGVLSEVAAMESENTSTRVKSSRAYAERVGFWHGGTVPFGYRVDEHPQLSGHKALAINTAEAGALRTVVDGVLDRGWSLTDAVEWLNTPPAPRPRRAERWSPTSLQLILTGHALLGRITKDGKPVYDAAGAPLAPWEPLVPLDTWHRLRARFSDPRTRSKASAAASPPKRKPKQTRILSGLVRCGSCGAVMYANTRTVAGQSRDQYACSAAGQGKPCERGVKIMAEQLEEHVEAEFLRVKGSASPASAQRHESGASPAELAEVAEAINATTAAMIGAPRAEKLALIDRLEQLEERQEDLRSAPARVVEVPVPAGVTLGTMWESLPERRPELLRGNVESITVGPGKPGRGFDTSRVTIEWRELGSKTPSV